MGTAPTGSTRSIGWATRGETGATEEVAGGIVGAVWGTEVEAEVVGAAHGVEGEVGFVVHGSSQIRRAGGQTARGGGRTVSLCNAGGRTT
jgi:hypothetical protein